MTTQYDLLAEVYDMQYGGADHDIAFYVDLARAAQPPVLELACGTGRVTLRIAQAGVPVVGVASSAGMLARARIKADSLGDLPVRWVQADMREFQLSERFGLAMIPARSFLHLVEPADQVQALVTIRDHLIPGGRLALNLFVPDLHLIAQHSGSTPETLQFSTEFLDPESGDRIVVWDSRRYVIPTQHIHNRFRYEQVDTRGAVIATRCRELSLCYIWPREMEHLLVRCGFEIEALYGWFDHRPFEARSSEQVWIARRL